MGVEEVLAGAAEALEAGRWGEARAGFEAALADGESADALLGLADALFWLADAPGCAVRMEQAYAALRRGGRLADAATVAIWLSAVYKKCLGNQAACGGWVARAARLVDEGELAPLRGWLELARAYDATEPARALEHAERALGEARGGEDPDLELCALGELGTALVAVGRVQEGLALCDEAMAATLAGEYGSRDTVVAATCSMITACDLAADLERVREWCRVADDFMRTYGCPFLFGDCRMRYGRVLVSTGNWEDAERELAAAAAATPPDSEYHVRAVASLAELRVAQGRVEEADALLAPLADAPSAQPARAKVHHARGEHAIAAAILERFVESGDGVDPQVLRALGLLAEVHAARGDPEAAGRAAAALVPTAGAPATGPAEAHALLAAGRVAAAAGRRQEAIALLARAADLLGRANLPYRAACARLLLARTRADDAPDAAVADAQRALATFERVGAAPDAGAAAALLRSLGAAARTGPKGVGVLTQREQEVLRLLGAGLSNPEIAERLVISRKTASHHVSNVLAKLGLRNRAEAAAHAARLLADAPSRSR